MRSGFWTLAAFVLVLDQWTKALVERFLPFQRPIPVLGDVLSLTHVRNSGTAFGLLTGGGVYLTVVAIAAAILIALYWVRLSREQRCPNIWLACGLALPLGGAVGNLVDRVRIGQVIDFIDLHVWPVFNVADMAITVGACLVAYYYFFIHERPPRDLAPAVPETGAE